MGKPGAFLDIDRKTHAERPVSETVHDFDEFAVPLSEDEQRAQASRCMYCGVAFCQAGLPFGKAGRTSGCPLHNLIPEWNDLVYRGLWADASERLAMTNPFPEFTGRVCPALCEAACNLGLHEGPTAIKDNERAISDHDWAAGDVRPLPKPAADAPKVAVVGSGPAGLGVAWELARRGAAVTVFERSDRAGGLLMYGIPNMKLPKDVVQRRVDLMADGGVAFELGCDASDEEVAERILSDFDAVVVTCGAGAARGLAAPGADLEGVHFAVDYLTSSTKSVLSGDEPLVSAKGKDVMVIGGGDTGTDCVATALRQGAKSVSQLEFLPAPPDGRTPENPWPEWPMVKKTDYGQVEAANIQGADPRTWATDTLEVLGEGSTGSGAKVVSGLRVVSLDWSQGKPDRMMDTERVIPAQLVLLAMGFTGPQSSVFDALGIEMSEGRRVLPVMESVDGHRAKPIVSLAEKIAAKGDAAAGAAGAAGQAPVFAAGDARNGSTLVVTALADGLACAAEVAEALGL